MLQYSAAQMLRTSSITPCMISGNGLSSRSLMQVLMTSMAVSWERVMDIRLSSDFGSSTCEKVQQPMRSSPLSMGSMNTMMSKGYRAARTKLCIGCFITAQR